MTCLLIWWPLGLTSADKNSNWCYGRPECDFKTWMGKCKTGSKQSPINLEKDSAVRNKSLTPIETEGYDVPGKITGVTKEENTVKVELGEGIRIRGGGLGGEYEAKSIVFRWGGFHEDGVVEDNFEGLDGSEHSINGKKYPMEMQINHVKLPGASGTTKDRAVLSFFIQKSMDKPKPDDLFPIYDCIDNLENGQNCKMDRKTTLTDFMIGANMKHYMRYEGSGTTPPCNENVIWTVYLVPLFIPASLIKNFSILKNEEFIEMKNVYRPIQPLNGRTVYLSAGSSIPTISGVALVVWVSILHLLIYVN
ncbi:carbonic anhydrase 4-like [Erpetoichthys calabaricus]|uniref:carbonic anhydrase 4-like n=1 Tax=Erpetoichthys calabaricus TaxID=27687 RepID=UPI0022346F50|nr:carbonic anhydrase 4-like [Erpetoichthys calabaricus]